MSTEERLRDLEEKVEYLTRFVANLGASTSARLDYLTVLVEAQSTLFAREMITVRKLKTISRTMDISESAALKQLLQGPEPKPSDTERDLVESADDAYFLAQVLAEWQHPLVSEGHEREFLPVLDMTAISKAMDEKRVVRDAEVAAGPEDRRRQFDDFLGEDRDSD